MSDSLSLREIRSELLDMLIEHAELERDIEAADGAPPIHILETKVALEEAIKAYGLAKAEKVDQIAYVLKRLERDADFDETEGKRLIARAKARRAAKDRLKDYVKGEFIAAGETKVEGEHNTLKLEANAVSVDDYDIGLIPDALKKQSLTFDCATWVQIVDTLAKAKHTILALELVNARQKAEATADKFNIKSVLACPACKAGVAKAKCEACDSTGYAPCSQCEGSGYINFGDDQCTQCGGSGFATVPGAKLEFGQKLVVR